MRWALGLVLVLGSAALGALGTEVHDAVLLELQGRLTEARESYRTLLFSRDFGSKPTTDSRALRLFLLKKLGHLALDLGRTDEAWDLQLQLRALGSSAAVDQANTIRARILQPHTSTDNTPWDVLATPARLIAEPVSKYSRLQMGAFSDWNHVRTQLDILIEKGWSPWCEERVVGKGRLVAVFVVSRNPAGDLPRLKAQGFTPTASSIDVRG